MKQFSLLLVCGLFFYNTQAQTFSLLKDINISSNGCAPDNFTPGPLGLTYFTADNPGSGRQMFTTDGTSANTTALMAADRDPMFYDGTILYYGRNMQLWKTYGTVAGSSQVKASSGPTRSYGFKAVNGKVVFFGNSSAAGYEPWVTDGTDAGTFMLKDIYTGTSGSSASELTEMNGFLYFRANDGTNGDELWRTDGTTAGTTLVKNINTTAGTGSFPANLIRVNNFIYFGANNGTNGTELWKTDGTNAGTVLVKDITAGATGSNIGNMAAIGTTVYFASTTGLWKSDGTSAGTVAVKTGISLVEDLININGTIFFSAYTAATGLDLYTSNGTTAGTVMIKNFTNSEAYPEQFCNVNNKLMFVAREEGFSDYEVWISDGTTNGTVYAKNVNTIPGGGANSYDLTVSNNKLYWWCSDPVNGDEPYVSDGTPAGTMMLKNINSNTLSGMIYPDYFRLGSDLLFAGNDTYMAGQLYKTDGTEAGTTLLSAMSTGYNHPQEFFNLNGTVFFRAGDEYNTGYELWKTNGTAAGTSMVKDIYPFSGSSFPQSFVSIGTTLYFVANDGTNGNELWKSDGTNAGTVMVKNIHPSSDGVLGNKLVVYNGILYFNGQNGDATGAELWRSDGTSAGTYMLKDIYATGSSSPMELTVFNGMLYFRAQTSAGVELWKSDGTAAGTVLLKDINPSGHSFPQAFTVFNDKLLFYASDNNGAELWMSDGTASGTVMVKDITPGAASTSFGGFYVASNQVFFKANNGSNGEELWRTDATTAGTYLLKDINPGPASGSVDLVTVYQNSVFFKAYNPSTYYEVWQSDGTTTRMVEDFNPGIGNSDPRFMAVLGSQLIVSLNTPLYGNELHTALLSTVVPVSLLEFNGRLQSNNALLDWKTTNELNTDIYQVERSLDGIHFYPIGNVAAFNTAGIHNYGFTDKDIDKLATAVIYYRLKIIDRDGKFVLSPVVKLAPKVIGTTVSVYPNPVIDRMMLSIATDQPASLYGKLINSSGQVAGNYQLTVQPGHSNHAIDLSKLAAGNYYLEINNDKGWSDVIKVVKQ